MMLLSIIGIIWVQIVWIKNVVGIRNESFNNAVIVSLNNAASSMETSRKVDFFNNFMMGDPFSIGDSSVDFTGYLNIGSYTSVPGNNFSLRITNQSVSQSPDNGKVTTVNKSYLITNDTIISDSVTSNSSLSEGLNKTAVGRRGEGVNNSRRATYIRQNDFLDWYKKRSGDFQYMS